MFAWDPAQYVELDNITCTNNTAEDKGGCMYTAGNTTINKNVVMLDNTGGAGGCICELPVILGAVYA